MYDDIFLWNWKVFKDSKSFFWFDRNEHGAFGYRMEYSPDVFEPWDEEEARKRLPTLVKYSTRTPICGPFLSEAPPLIQKIRLMEQRHKRYSERKHHA